MTFQSSSQWFWTGRFGLFSQDRVPRSDLQQVVNTSALTSGLWQGLKLNAKKSGIPSLFVDSWAGAGTVRLWETLTVLSFVCEELCLGLWGAGSPVSCPQCALEQITHFYFYTNVHNFIHFLWLLWQEKEIYDAHHPFIWHRQCLLLREAFSWNWLHNFLLVYCFQVISQDLCVLRYRDTSLGPTEYCSRGKKEAT